VRRFFQLSRINDLKCCTEKISWTPSPHELRIAEFTQISEFTYAAPMLGLFLMHLIGLDKFHTFMAEPVIFFYWVDEQVSFYTVLSQLVCPEKYLFLILIFRGVSTVLHFALIACYGMIIRRIFLPPLTEKGWAIKRKKSLSSDVVPPQ
jgi:hypothetical protein